MTITPPAGTEEWSPEKREAWRRLVETPLIEALPPEFREAVSVVAACIADTPYPYANEAHRGAPDQESVGKSGGPADGGASAVRSEDIEGMVRRFMNDAEAMGSSWVGKTGGSSDWWGRIVAEERAKSLLVALECLGRAASRPAKPAEDQPRSGAVDNLVSALHPGVEDGDFVQAKPMPVRRVLVAAVVACGDSQCKHDGTEGWHWMLAKELTDEEDRPRSNILDAIEKLVSSLYPDSDGMVLRVPRRAFGRLVFEAQKTYGTAPAKSELRDDGSNILVAYYNGVRIEAEP